MFSAFFHLRVLCVVQRLAVSQAVQDVLTRVKGVSRNKLGAELNVSKVHAFGGAVHVAQGQADKARSHAFPYDMHVPGVRSGSSGRCSDLHRHAVPFGKLAEPLANVLGDVGANGNYRAAAELVVVDAGVDLRIGVRGGCLSNI